MDTPHPARPAAQPAPLPAPLPAPPAAPSTPRPPREAVSLDDLNAAAAARERDDADWCTHALLHRPSPPAPAPSSSVPPPAAAASKTS